MKILVLSKAQIKIVELTRGIMQIIHQITMAAEVGLGF